MREKQPRNQDHQVNIWFTAKEKAELKDLAERLDTSMSEIIRRGIAIMAVVDETVLTALAEAGDR